MGEFIKKVVRAFVRGGVIGFSALAGFLAVFCFIFSFLLSAVLGKGLNFEEQGGRFQVIENCYGIKNHVNRVEKLLLKIDITKEIGAGGITADTIDNMFFSLKNNKELLRKLRGVLISVDCPGGSALETDKIYRRLKEWKNKLKVPFFVYVDGICASGGYYLSVAADKIFCSPISMIGSIGVISSPYLNFSQLLDKLGVQSKTIYCGRGKDEMNSFRPWNEEDGKTTQGIVENLYNRFVKIVAEERGISSFVVSQDFGAGLYMAEEAVERLMVDGVCEGRDQVEMKMFPNNQADYSVLLWKAAKSSRFKFLSKASVELQKRLSSKTWYYLYVS